MVTELARQNKFELVLQLSHALRVQQTCIYKQYHVARARQQLTNPRQTIEFSCDKSLEKLLLCSSPGISRIHTFKSADHLFMVSFAEYRSFLLNFDHFKQADSRTYEAT